LFIEDKTLVLTKYLRLFVLLPILVSFVQAQRTHGAAGAMEFPRYKLIEGAKDGPYFAATGAQLCLADGLKTCFALSPQKAKFNGEEMATQFGLMPEGQRISIRAGGSLVLFFADSGGGSDSGVKFALLRYRRDQPLYDLLPEIELSNQSDHALWDIPSLSPMPLLVTADFLWEGPEGHYGRHFYEIHTYRYNANIDKYEQILKYQTKRKYRGFDNFDDPFPLLKYEKSSILRKLGVH
jgi:hypothetical protein